MNNFKTLRVINEADADEFVIDIDDDEEELIAKAGKEAEFVDLHTAVSIAHPVAGDNQFKSDKDQAVTQNAESDNAEGEDKPVKQGTTGDTKFAQFRDKIGKTPARKGDKSQGDMKSETVKEEVEIEEGILELEDGEFVYVSDDDAEVFNTILEELEPENRELMIIRMNENEDSYEEMLEFAKGMV